jgi:single-strand DNA-binding protein
MAGSLNKVMLIGNVGADPEIRNLDANRSVANFSIATSQSWKDKQTGEKKEVTQWHRIVVWVDGMIGVIEKYVKKGSKIYVEGELQTRKWEKDGVDHYTTEVVLTGFDAKLVLLGDGGGGKASDPNGNAERPGNKSYAEQSGGMARDKQAQTQRELDDEIPF